MKIFICGDSTAADYDPAKTVQTGWGQALRELMPEAEIRNHAMAGRSTRTFLGEGRLDRVMEEIGPGDLMLIQFAHNDENREKPERFTEPRGAYQENLRIFIEAARSRNAVPVLLTPICLRIWQDGALTDTHGEYRAAMEAVAESCGVPLIDAYRESFRIVQEAGEEGSRELFMPEDIAHTGREGAARFARAIAEAIRELKMPEKA